MPALVSIGVTFDRIECESACAEDYGELSHLHGFVEEFPEDEDWEEALKKGCARAVIAWGIRQKVKQVCGLLLSRSLACSSSAQRCSGTFVLGYPKPRIAVSPFAAESQAVTDALEHDYAERFRDIPFSP